MSTSTAEHSTAPSTSSVLIKDTGKSPKYSYKECRTVEDLLPFEQEWRELSHRAAEKNPFYEPWNVLAALKHLIFEGDVSFILILKADFSKSSGRSLCGLFPVETKDVYEGIRPRSLPIKTISLWRHKYCYLCTPLIEEECEQGAVDTFFEWLENSDSGARLMEFPFVPTHGPFFNQIIQRFHTLGTPTFRSDIHTRALLTREESVDRYFKRHIAGSDLREARRRERLLSKKGKVEYLVHGGKGGVSMVEEFLALEAKSWKGVRHCDLMSAPNEAAYFREAATKALVDERMEILALHLDGEAIAIKCNYCAPPASYSFKISYNQEYAKLGPGILLELEHIRRLHASPSLQWTDSCAVYNNATFNRLYNERLPVQDFVVGTGKGRGEFIISAIPLVRHCFRTLKRVLRR